MLQASGAGIICTSYNYTVVNILVFPYLKKQTKSFSPSPTLIIVGSVVSSHPVNPTSSIFRAIVAHMCRSKQETAILKVYVLLA